MSGSHDSAREQKTTGEKAERLADSRVSAATPSPTREIRSTEKVGSEFAATTLNRLRGRADTFDRYRLDGEIARGGQGVILLVWDEDLRRNLAMKVVLGRSDESSATPPIDSRTLARFLEEAQVTGQLDHPGIVPVHEMGLDAEGRVYFTMKLVKGEDLSAVIRKVHEQREGWTRTRALGVLLKACEAMSYAHAKGVIHRDLKPGNVMVGRFGEVYVMDWGLARILGEEDAKDIRIRDEAKTTELRSGRREAADATPSSPLLTMDGDVVGTPAYMPPEQARGDLAAMGPHSDVYSVGAILYHLLSGHMPYHPPGVRASAFAVWGQVQAGPPPPVGERVTDVPAELVAICEKAMAREPARRYRDMEEFATDLRAFLEDRVVGAYETGVAAELRKWIRRNRPLVGAIAAALVLALGGLAAVLAFQNERRREAELQGRILSDLQELATLQAEADALWPLVPELEEPLEAWLGRAHALVERSEKGGTGSPSYAALLDEQRSHALPWTPEEQVEDRETHPLRDRLRSVQTEVTWLEAARSISDGQESPVPTAPELVDPLDEALGRTEEKRAEELLHVYQAQRRRVQHARSDAGARRIAALESERADLEDRVASRRTYRFPAEDERWRHAQLERLVMGIRSFAGEHGPLHGELGVVSRLERIRRIREESLNAASARTAWAEAIRSIATECPPYLGLALEPQYGLVPIGRDPQSGLWEFSHISSGSIAKRSMDGELVFEQDTGIVFTLLPGKVAQNRVNLSAFGLHFGSEDLGQTLFQMSESQLAISSKVIEADLAPCLVSKLEINRGQWLRLGGSLDAPLPEQDGVPGGPVEDALYPVERVSHPDCVRTLERAALALPSGLQLRHAPLGGDSGIRHLPDIDWVWTSDPDRSNPGGLNGEHFRYYAMPASPTVERMFFATERRSGLGVRPVFPLREPPPVR